MFRLSRNRSLQHPLERAGRLLLVGLERRLPFAKRRRPGQAHSEGSEGRKAVTRGQGSTSRRYGLRKALGSRLQGQRELMAVFGIKRRCWGKAARHGTDVDLAHNKAGKPAQRHALYSQAILHFAKTPGFVPERRPGLGAGGGVG